MQCRQHYGRETLLSITYLYILADRSAALVLYKFQLKTWFVHVIHKMLQNYANVFDQQHFIDEVEELDTMSHNLHRKLNTKFWWAIKRANVGYNNNVYTLFAEVND